MICVNKLDLIRPEKYNEDEYFLESVEIRDQISLLEIEQSLWEQKIYKIDQYLNDTNGKPILLFYNS